MSIFKKLYYSWTRRSAERNTRIVSYPSSPGRYYVQVRVDGSWEDVWHGCNPSYSVEAAWKRYVLEHAPFHLYLQANRPVVHA